MRKLFRGRILHCLGDPDSEASAVEYLEDGVLIVEGGKVVDLVDATRAENIGLRLDQARELKHKLIVPGFIDTHIHAPQMDIIASYGAQLLDWLEQYTFPTEMRFVEPEFAELAMAEFIGRLLSNGTTSALVFSTSHEHATEALFRAAAKQDMCLIAGKVLMDRNAPQPLLDTAESGYEQSKRLIEKWHQCGRLAYAITPRFAITSTPEQLSKAGDLMNAVDGLYMQTHLSETQDEIAEVKKLFPDIAHYLDAYDRYGLCTERSFFGHSIHLEQAELDRLNSSGSKVAFCPSSNLFLGSGLFDWKRVESAGISISLASDVGAGISVSMLNTMSEAYKVCQLQDMSLAPMKAFYTATLGNARSLGLEERIGNFTPGSDADFLVLDASNHAPLKQRLSNCETIENEWFAYMMLGDERLVSETWVAGDLRHSLLEKNIGSGADALSFRSAV